jgi:single-stranded DNA-binding protein
MAMNTCFFEGFVVGKKPMKVSANGKEVLTFGLSILINHQATNPKEKTTIFNFVAFDKTGRNIDDATNGGSNYLHIQSTPKINRYTDGNGNEHSNTVFWVSSATCHSVSTSNNRQASKSLANAETRTAKKAPEEDGFEDFV